METKQIKISKWVDLYTAKLYKWALQKLHDEDLAKDLVQDTFLAAFENLEKFKGQSSELTWLFGILNNKIKAHYTQTKKMSLQPLKAEAILEDIFEDNGHWKSTAAEPVWHESIELLDNPSFLKVFKLCLSNLPLQWQDTLLQKFILGTDPKEICQALDISVTNYWQIIHRAKLMMRMCLDKNWRE